MARFNREAQLLASLNHPNIGAIYGLEDAHGAQALVMELVEGPTLADRIAQGRLALPDAVAIAIQIAQALEVAHERGIIHRDLKPANIKVTADGTVKVLDFGLAKALDPPMSSDTNALNSPTLSAHATHAGIILGTAAYMAPEQARGLPVDRRADVWAFGCVLFEMLTGSGRSRVTRSPTRWRPFSSRARVEQPARDHSRRNPAPAETMPDQGSEAPAARPVGRPP